ncbi:Nicotinamide-nucleotide adenylyltransferase, NadM family [Methanosarcina lacustris Z-7289]|uniref:Nicotinamide-nucleotide adenylyltransferase n=1 Tax=Methanosarcina lacustris Z-7289 TaxID=1434111 RepID=A0A0E3S8P8_9EURY|nr:nicotinamide-nucleotide adenylyltransferase [Methanosarcina lacustris]AKB75498.1 Nicotinamide-nucleotide adenylyltransferase, NadM family [Methanosarcina lacustris Z-7289]
MIRAFYIGRFQPYHFGHHTVITRIAEEVDELVIGVGSAQKSHEATDPFTAGERVLMLYNALEHLPIRHYVLPIEDVRYNSIWVHHVASRTPRFDVVYSNNPLVIQLFREAGFCVKESPLYIRDRYSGTEIRRRMIAGEKWEHLVPKPIVETIKDIDGITRLRNVSASDNNFSL